MALVSTTMVLVLLAVYILIESFFLAVTGMLAYKVGFNLKQGFWQWLFLLIIRLIIVAIVVVLAITLGGGAPDVPVPTE